MHHPRIAVVILTVLASAGCTQNVDSSESNSASSDPRAITVTSTDDTCDVSSVSVPAGTLTFDVTNNGSQVTEFYLLGSDGLRIVGEVENVGPQLSRQLVVNAPAGTYTTACKPGMTGDGIRSDFEVTESKDAPSMSPGDQQAVDQALKNYQVYVRDQSDQLVVKTQEFVDLYKAGDDAAARALYPKAREHWERIETVAESFGDLDPLMDAREVDLEPGQEWTGWHLLEKDLWPAAAKGYTPLSSEQRHRYADGLMSNTEELDRRVQKLTYTVDQIANGSRGLLEEVAKGKVTGEEEIWSHTDLWDFQANIDGARVGFEGLQPLVEQNDPALANTLTTRFDELQTLLDQHRRGTGFAFYDDLSRSDIQTLSAAVNALSEPLSRLTAAVVS